MPSAFGNGREHQGGSGFQGARSCGITTGAMCSRRMDRATPPVGPAKLESTFSTEGSRPRRDPDLFCVTRCATASSMARHAPGVCSWTHDPNSLPSISSSWAGSWPKNARFLPRSSFGFITRDYHRPGGGGGAEVHSRPVFPRQHSGRKLCAVDPRHLGADPQPQPLRHFRWRSS